MAWISVHEQVIGGKLRNLSKEIGCSQNEALGLLVRLWLWGINNANKEGLIVDADKNDVAEILTIGIDKRYSAGKAVSALILTNWIDINDNGLYIHDWQEWQKQWYRAIETRERNTQNKRKERERAKLAKESGKYYDKNSKVPQEADSSEQKLPNQDLYSTEFEEFWSLYPRKLGKGEAYKKYQARLKDGWSPSELKTAAKAYFNECVRKKTDKEYIKHAKTFLSDNTPFIDYLPKNEDKTITDDNNPYEDWR